MLPIGRQSLQFYNDHQFFHQLILIQYCNVATANSFIELCVENTLNCALCYVSSDGLLGGGSKGAGGVEVAHPEGGHLLPREPSAPGLGLSNRIVLSLFIRSSQVLLNSLQLFYMRKKCKPLPCRHSRRPRCWASRGCAQSGSPQIPLSTNSNSKLRYFLN